FQEKQDWPNAISAARRAEGLLAGGSIRHTLRDRVVARRADLDMVKRLDEVPVNIHVSGGGNVGEALAASYGQAFREFGIDVEALIVEESADLMRHGSIQLQLASALEDWGLAITNSKEAKGVEKKLWAIANAVDTDPYRKRLRDAVETMDPEVLK